MLREFRVSNHRSIADEQVLTLELSGSDTASDAKTILPIAAIYGANASGKSNVLSALEFCASAVVSSSRLWRQEKVPRTPFAWGDQKNQPSLFECDFVLRGVDYNYGFVVDDSAVLEEWLFASSDDGHHCWFERSKQDFTFGEHLIGENETISRLTRENALFLSTAEQFRHQQLKLLVKWFRRLRLRLGNKTNLSRFHPAFEYLAGSSSLHEFMKHFLQKADTGIQDIGLEKEPPSLFDDRARPRRVLFQHQTDNEESWLPLAEQSQGTRTLFNTIPLVFDALRGGGILLIDELEASLHPNLAREIVRLFLNPESNRFKAQLIFTTHDTNLLGASPDEYHLQREHVWLTEKTEKGNTVLYPLTDFKPRAGENLERGYLQGRYGAIPFLGNLQPWTQPVATPEVEGD